MNRWTLAVAVFLVSAAPLAAFQHETTDDPRCTEALGTNCPHLGIPFFWPADQMPVVYVVNSDLSGVSFGAARDAVNAAFSTWQSASSNGITFAFGGQSHGGSDGRDGQNTISWQPLTNSSDTFAQSIITFEKATGVIVDVDTELNANFEFAVLPTGEDDPSDPRPDIEGVVTHEVGHLLGLDHENRFGTQVVMFFSDTSGNTTHRALTSDDRSGVRSIYSGGSNGGGSGGGGGGGGGCALARSRHDAELWPVAMLIVALGLRRWANRARAPRRAPSTRSRPSRAGCVGPDR